MPDSRNARRKKTNTFLEDVKDSLHCIARNLDDLKSCINQLLPVPPPPADFPSGDEHVLSKDELLSFRNLGDNILFDVSNLPEAVPLVSDLEELPHASLKPHYHIAWSPSGIVHLDCSAEVNNASSAAVKKLSKLRKEAKVFLPSARNDVFHCVWQPLSLKNSRVFVFGAEGEHSSERKLAGGPITVSETATEVADANRKSFFIDLDIGALQCVSKLVLSCCNHFIDENAEVERFSHMGLDVPEVSLPIGDGGRVLARGIEDTNHSNVYASVSPSSILACSALNVSTSWEVFQGELEVYMRRYASENRRNIITEGFSYDLQSLLDQAGLMGAHRLPMLANIHRKVDEVCGTTPNLQWFSDVLYLIYSEMARDVEQLRQST